jgi:multidrug resistance efflux pump
VVELIIGTYGVACWLVFKKFKLIPVTTYTICSAFLGGIVILVGLYIMLSVFHPVAHDGRMYGPIVQIVPNVRGTVTEIPVKANVLIKKGDVLFRIDPQPYQYEVDRLQALLAVKHKDVARVTEQLAGAEAATKEQRANLLVAESQFDRQARESHEQALAHQTQVDKRLDLAKSQLERAKKLLKDKNISQEEYDRDVTKVSTLEDEQRDVAAAVKITKEKLQTGSSSLEAVRQDIARLEAAERDLRVQLKAVSESDPKVTADVREVMAQLDKARWDLDQCVVRAPADGYVPQLTLRTGQMAVQIPLKPLMVFVVTEQPTLIASFAQKAISDIKPGMHAEVVFKAHPGRTFKVKVRRIMTAIPEGEILASGQLLETTPSSEPGYVPIVFDYDEDVAALNLPIGAQASIAIYTDRVHALSIVRKIVLRMKSWESFLF